MWLKLCLLLLYVTLLFIIARLIEALTWYETGSLSRRLLDPMTLSVLKLKALLHQRGVTYDGVLEKSELSNLAEATGPVMQDEVELSLNEDEKVEETVFESGAHFYEQVEDAKDSVWMISVIMGESSHQRFVSDAVWKSIRKRVTRFGVRVGVMDCSKYPRYCDSRGLISSRLLLALPQDFKTKANLKIHRYNGSARETAINQWIHEKLDEKVHNIQSFREFKDEWSTFKHSLLDPEIRTVLFINEPVMPMFYSALSLRFPGRVKFGKVDLSAKDAGDFQSFFHNNSLLFGPLPHYLVITPEEKYLYGYVRGEYLTFESLELYFKTLYPSLNDLFVLSFVIVNVMSWFEFFEVQGLIGKRLRKFLWCVIKYNVLLIMMWLPIVGLFSLPNLDKVRKVGLKLVRIVSMSSLPSLVRKDVFFYSQHLSWLGFSFLTYAVCVGILQYMRRDDSTLNEVVEEDLWNFNQMRTLEHLFRPADSVGQLESGFTRFAGVYNPTLWLRPSGSIDYIQLLPTWKYTDMSKPIITPTIQNIGTEKSPLEESEESVEKAPKSISNENTNASITSDKSLEADIQMNVSFPSGYLPSTQCVICLDDYTGGITLCGLPCGHSFHEQCIVSWLNRDNHFCPVCRWPADQPKSATLHLHCE